MHMTEVMRVRGNKKAQRVAEETLRKCEEEKFSMADLKDFVCILKGMVNKTLQLNEENNNFIFLQSDGRVSQNNNVDTHQQNHEDHLHQ